ncbi:MAG: phosphodiesterase [Fibrobacter sp.]|nr:phosphodiesterase [Fibrobacter sp.]
MRALILSDIHGSADAVRKALAYFDLLHCDKIFLLGDILYHGPRNPLPEGHGPMGVVEALQPFADKIVAVRGNCDADVDLMMLEYIHIAEEYAYFEDPAPTPTADNENPRRAIRLFLSHGHIFQPECFPRNAMDQLEPNAERDEHSTELNPKGTRPIDAYLYGHTHIWDLHKNFRNVLNVNPGSTSLPKGGNPATFGIYESFDQPDSRGNFGKFSIYKLDNGKELASIDLNDRNNEE